jgi:hypothetical protein
MLSPASLSIVRQTLPAVGAAIPEITTLFYGKLSADHRLTFPADFRETHARKEIPTSELRPEQGKHPSSGVAALSQRSGRGLRTFLADMREAWSDPAIPAANPVLRDYPTHRP